MGFFGDFILARSDRLLRELPQISNNASCGEGHADCLHECTPRADGWQTLQFHHWLPGEDPGQWVREVVTVTNAPALVARVMDSDVCQVWGHAPSGAAWTLFLDPETAAAYDFPIPGEEEQHAVTEDIAPWAAEAGCTADRDALLALTTKRADPLVEDLFFELIDACGLPAINPDSSGTANPDSPAGTESPA